MTGEFSVENILFLMESEQFIRELQRRHPSLAAEEVGLVLEFAKKAPKSAIVLKRDDLSVYQKAIHIFDKYVRVSDELTELNLSYYSRQSVYSVFAYSNNGGYAKGTELADSDESTHDLMIAGEWLSKRMELKQLVHVFDEPRKQAFNMVRDAFTRLQRSDPYLGWQQRHEETLMKEAEMV